MKLIFKISLVSFILSLVATPVRATVFDVGPHTETLFVETKGTPEQVRVLTNLFSSSAAYGIWSNKALNGMGNRSLLAKNPQPEGYFSQLLRTLSLFDLYFTSGVQRLQSTMKGSDAASMVVVGGSLKSEFVTQQPEPNLSFLGPGVSLGLVDLGPLAQFAVRQMPAGAVTMNLGNAQFPSTIFRKEFNQGLAFRYWNLKERAELGNANVAEKVAAQNALFWPMGFVGTLHVEPKGKNASKARYLLLMAAPGELKTPAKDPRSWEITPIAQALKKPLETEFATVTQVLYDGAGRSQRDNLSLLQIETQKDFNARPNEMDIVLSFGHQATSEGDTVTGLSYKLPNESLRMAGFLRLRELESSTFGDWKVVKKITDFVRTFQVEVGFHQLGLTLVREAVSGSARQVFAANPTFNLKYNPKHSLLSYRIFKEVPKDEAKSLELIGFQCKELGSGNAYCDRLFWSAKDVAQGFFKDFNRGIVANVFSKILGKITKDAFKEELPEITSEVNEALAQMVLKIIEDGQRAKALTTQTTSLQQLSPEALAQILGR